MVPEPRLTLYHAPMSRSVRVRWCLEEMGLPHTLERLGAITAEARGNLGGDAYRAINPLQKVPALKDGDQVILESLAMLEYLAGKHGPTPLALTPDEPDYGRYLEWLHFGEAAMAMSVNLTLAHTTLLPEAHRNKGMGQWARSEVDKQLAFISERGLENGARQYLAGDRLTLADMSIGYILFLLKIVKQFDGAPQSVRDYFDHLRQGEAWKRASAD